MPTTGELIIYVQILEHLDEFFVGVGVGAVAGLEVSQSAFVVFLSESVGGFLCNNNVISQTVSVGRGVATAHVCVEAGDDNGLHTEFVQQNVEVGLEETAVTAFWYHIVFVAEVELWNDIGTRSALDGVVAPQFQLTVNTLDVAVVAEDDGYTGFASCIEQSSSSGNDFTCTVAAESTSYEIIEHVNNKDSGFVQFVHLVN